MSGSIEVIVATDADGRRRVLSPLVGWWTPTLVDGALAAGGARLGSAVTAGRTRGLRLPDGLSGRLRADCGPGRRAVAYGEELYSLEPIDASAVDAGDADAADRAPAALSVAAPTDGVFYRRPSPDAAAFVETGGRVVRGQPIGLVEVMKTFNQVLYGGPGLPDEAIVVELAADDGEEVAAGQPLLTVRRP